ncbi:MAG: DUF192 domain-containing protein, partial [Magnetococcales bacterium]|nr:DUF192 domain-containing protein [Magnetococcales bacterium]
MIVGSALFRYLIGFTFLPAPASAEGQAWITLGKNRIRVELAETPEERERGLSQRSGLCPDCGMLFIFPTPQPACFWMRDTWISLDILYFDEERRLFQVLPSLPPRPQGPFPSPDPPPPPQ